MILAFRYALERRRQRAEQTATLRALEAGMYRRPAFDLPRNSGAQEIQTGSPTMRF